MTGTGAGFSKPVAMSAKGRFVLFQSTAKDLVANEIGGTGDLYVRDVVDADSRGLGIASGLVETAASRVERQGAPRVVLWTAERNPGAQRLFGRLGSQAHKGPI